MHALGVIVCAQLTTALGSYPHGGHAARVKQPSPNCLRRGLGCPVHGDSCNVTSHSSSSISHRSALVAPPPLAGPAMSPTALPFMLLHDCRGPGAVHT